jgi:hypothetical protein
MTAPAQSFIRFEQAAQATMPSTRSLFDYWQGALQDGLPPTRGEIDPAALKPILPYILLGDIEPDPFRVLFRLVGTAVAEFSRHDFTGRYLDELSYNTRDSVDWSACYRVIHTTHAPLIGVNDLAFEDGRKTRYEFAILPLKRGADPAGSFIAIEAYDLFDRYEIPDLTPVTRF